MKHTLSSLLILCSLVGQNVRAQVTFSPDERRIITIADERRNADSLLPYLSSDDIRVARRAAVALGNMGDTTVRAELLKSLQGESRDTVADAEAFSLGLLGPNAKICEGLIEASNRHPTAERLIAMVRTAPRGMEAAMLKAIQSLVDRNAIDPLAEAKVYVVCALHKEIDSKAMENVSALANNSDPNVRWRAAYAFARSGDSADLGNRFALLKDLLLDQGSPYVRMFGASAMGTLHDVRAEKALNEAYRGEEDWRVRVNILNALKQFPRADSAIIETAGLAVSNAVRDSTIAIQIGLTAAEMVDHFVTSGTLAASDSNDLRNWLDGFNGTDGRNEEIAPMVACELTISAARLKTPTLFVALQNYGQYNDPIIRNIAVRAASTLSDTTYFSAIVETMAAVGPVEQVVRLDALDSMWQRAKHEPSFRAQLEANKTADLYRHLLIHISDAVQDAAVDCTALSHLQDTSIVRDSAFKAEAREYVAKYILMFSQHQYRDELLSAVEADSWLDDRSETAAKNLHIAYDSANGWFDREVLDSISSSLRRIEGPSVRLPKRNLRYSKIDWDAIESIPPRTIINFIHGSVIVRLHTYEAPLTVLNMVQLARKQYFSGNVVHRVVPNFVIQTGDPTGTGWGGPGYSIRSEFTPEEYDREGMLGMASDGKDTEGSQWFITESPTPHLDAHYTIWADVTSGMDEVFNKIVGDRVDTVIPFR